RGGRGRRMPHAPPLASWAGLCPGNHERAGKRRSGRTRHGNRWLRSILVQAAWAASHTRATYRSAPARRLPRRRGNKKALGAVAATPLGGGSGGVGREGGEQAGGAAFLERLGT